MRRILLLIATVIGLAGLSMAEWSVVGAEAANAAPPSRTPALHGQTASGQQVFAGQCAHCHGPNGEGADEGPSLHGLPRNATVVSGVEGIVRHGYGEMDPFADKLSASEMQAVARYVVSAFGSRGDTPAGGDLYRLNCAGCHGATARGGALIYSDENAPSLFDVPQAEIVAAVRGGPEEMPAFNQAALSDQQVASVAQYVEALKSPPREGGLDLRYPGPVTEGFVALVVGLGAAVLGAWWVERGGRG